MASTISFRQSRNMTYDVAEANAALERLIARFGEEMPIGSIVKTFVQAVRGLQIAGVEAGLIVAAEAMAGNRLSSRVGAEIVADRETA